MPLTLKSTITVLVANMPIRKTVDNLLKRICCAILSSNIAQLFLQDPSKVHIALVNGEIKKVEKKPKKDTKVVEPTKEPVNESHEKEKNIP